MHVITSVSLQRDFTIDLYILNISVADRTLVKSANYHLYGTKIIYLDFILTRSLNDFGLKASLDMVRKDNRNMNVFKMDTHGCDALKSSHDKMNLLKVIFREIFRVSNIPRKCPIAAVSIFKLSNHWIESVLSSLYIVSNVMTRRSESI